MENSMDFDKNYFAYMNELYQNDLHYPIYPLYPTQGGYAQEADYEKDFRKLQELFPKEARKIQEQIKEQCDQMEYEGSAMFDEYPDRYTLESICRKIYRDMNPEEEMTSMSYTRNPLYQMIQVMLIEEMYFRRCRYRRCRRRYW